MALTFEELLFELSLGDLNLDCLVHLLVVSSLVVGIVLDGGGEERVDEGSFSKARLASNLWAVSVPTDHGDSRVHTMIVKEAPRLATILCLCYCQVMWMRVRPRGIPLVGELGDGLASRPAQCEG